MHGESSSTLPWDALKHTEGDIPWRALDQFAEALVADPGLMRRLITVYDEFMDAEEAPPSYECLYVPAIFALAAPWLTEATRRKIADFLVEELLNAGADENLLLSKAMEAACGSMGPAALPAVLTAIERDEEVGSAWFSLWDLTGLAAKSDDAALRARVADECVRLLQQAEREELTPSEVVPAAWTLARLGRRDARPILQRLYDKSDNEEVESLELLEALHLMDGKLEPDPLDDLWERPVIEWLAQAWAGLREEYAEPEELAEEDDWAPAPPAGVDQDEPYREEFEGVTPPIVVPPAVGRNDPCPCGSGKKFKKCCGRAGHVQSDNA